jgi:hypothetical protein
MIGKTTNERIFLFGSKSRFCLTWNEVCFFFVHPLSTHCRYYEKKFEFNFHTSFAHQPKKQNSFIHCWFALVHWRNFWNQHFQLCWMTQKEVSSMVKIFEVILLIISFLWKTNFSDNIKHTPHFKVCYQIPFFIVVIILFPYQIYFESYEIIFFCFIVFLLGFDEIVITFRIWQVKKFVWNNDKKTKYVISTFSSFLFWVWCLWFHWKWNELRDVETSYLGHEFTSSMTSYHLDWWLHTFSYNGQQQQHQ